jgi:hypothetical protein
MRKGAVISLVRNILNGGSQDQDSSDFHESLIEEYVDSVLAQMMAEAILDDEDYGDLLRTFENVPLQKNEERDERYIELPVPLVNVSGALHSVTPMQDRKRPYPVLDAGEEAIYSSMDVASCMPFVYLEGNKVWFNNAPKTTKTVLVRMLASVSGLSENDNIPVPNGRQKDLVDMVVERFVTQYQIVEDSTNDNNTAQ